MNRQLTVQESRHRLARVICHGRRGQIHQAYREGQEDQLGCLGLVLNAVTLWMTRYLDAAVTQLRAQGVEVRAEDAARLSRAEGQEGQRAGSLRHRRLPTHQRPAAPTRPDKPRRPRRIGLSPGRYGSGRLYHRPAPPALILHGGIAVVTQRISRR